MHVPEADGCGEHPVGGSEGDEIPLVEHAAGVPDVGRDLLHADRVTRPAPPRRCVRAHRWRRRVSHELGPGRSARGSGVHRHTSSPPTSTPRVLASVRSCSCRRPGRPRPALPGPPVWASPENEAREPPSALEPCRRAELPTRQAAAPRRSERPARARRGRQSTTRPRAPRVTPENEVQVRRWQPSARRSRELPTRRAARHPCPAHPERTPYRPSRQEARVG